MTGPVAAPWQRLDRRMLLLHPVREVVRYIPVLLATVIIGTRNDNPMWGLGALAVIVAVAVTRWFTTTYRLGPDTVELRRGLIQRKTLTVPRSRIRSVDVHADLLHRLLGLAVLAIGTGQLAGREERFHLDGVDARAVPTLRAALLGTTPNGSAPTELTAPQAVPAGIADHEAGGPSGSVAATDRGTADPGVVTTERQSADRRGSSAATEQDTADPGEPVAVADRTTTDPAGPPATTDRGAAGGPGGPVAASDRETADATRSLATADPGTADPAGSIAAIEQGTVDPGRAVAAATRGPVDMAGSVAPTERSAAGQPWSVAVDEPDGAEIGHWRAGWVRYAPLSLTGLAIFGPLAGLASQYGATDRLVRSQTVQGLGRHSVLFLAVVALTGIAILLLVSAAAACLRYLTTWYGLRVIDDGRRLHINHGLFTTRQITLDLSRLRGATVNEPLLLRLAGAAELEAVMTGTRTRQRILPQAPRAAVDRTLAHLLSETIRQAEAEANTPARQPVPSEAWAPVTAEPLRHGPRAHRRRYTRALAPVALATVITLGIALGGNHIPVWVWPILALLGVAAAAVAEDRYRGLGHAILPGAGARPTWLITRDGSLDRERHCLAAPGVIGWTVRQTFFQRRAGLATVVAATAAGKKRYHIRDVPIDRAWALVHAVTPGILGAR
ncbi:PH domain-containing protein [Nocardia sp. BMG111209]|uniref:PH domain-containing protein n=1 Tax=Nocardia sp. BMG111209 TaxID=1160137 RepID=UPI0003759AA7|nr:PH domain-containing protein [Nocardia sp. BMG111209]